MKEKTMTETWMTDRRRVTRSPSLAFRALFAGLLAVGLLAPSGVAAEDLFLRLDGIKGESTDDQHAKEIVLLSYSQSFSKPPGGAPNPTNCGAIVVTKLIDRSSPALIGAVLTGTAIPTGQITFRKSGQTPLEYFKVMMTEVVIESINQSDSSSDPTTVF